MKKLRNLGIYSLPDGREVIAEVEPNTGYSLYFPQTWNQFRSTQYFLDQQGRLLINGKPSNWSVEHLIDTGRAARYPKSSKLL